jgi:hypothetical protein
MAHNGFIGALDLVRRDLALTVDPSLFPDIGGTTDTELLFDPALAHGLEDDPPTAKVRSWTVHLGSPCVSDVEVTRPVE